MVPVISGRTVNISPVMLRQLPDCKGKVSTGLTDTKEDGLTQVLLMNKITVNLFRLLSLDTYFH